MENKYNGNFRDDLLELINQRGLIDIRIGGTILNVLRIRMIVIILTI